MQNYRKTKHFIFRSLPIISKQKKNPPPPKVKLPIGLAWVRVLTGVSWTVFAYVSFSVSSAKCEILYCDNLSQQVYSIPLDSLGHKKLFWTVDYQIRRADFEIHTTLPPYGWFAIGFSDYGEIAPADYCVLWRDWRGHVSLQVRD